MLPHRHNNTFRKVHNYFKNNTKREITVGPRTEKTLFKIHVHVQKSRTRFLAISSSFPEIQFQHRYVCVHFWVVSVFFLSFIIRFYFKATIYLWHTG